MELFDCILTRSSKRDFTNIPVPKNILDRLLEVSLNAPSWANSQPWEIAVATGKTSEFIKEKIYKLALEDNKGNPDYPFPEFWPEKQSLNIFKTGKHRYETLGISRDDSDKRKEISLSNYLFFGSQTAIFIYMDQKLGHWSTLDCGMLIQNILLSAHGLGLGACPQAYLVRYPDVLRQAFKLPGNKKFVLGISVGYCKKDSPINQIKASKLSIKDAVTYYE